MMGLNQDKEIAKKQQHYYDFLSAFSRAVEKTKHLKRIFDKKWQDQVRTIIGNYDGSNIFGLQSNFAFIGFIQEDRDGGNFIQRLDESFGVIESSTKRVKTLRNKLTGLGGSIENYLGAVFEILILAPCIKSGFFKEYEPKLKNGKYPEASIEIDKKILLIEASVITTGRSLDYYGAVNIDEHAHKVCLKVQEKANQLNESSYGAIIFISPYESMDYSEIKLGLNKAFESGKCNNVVAVIVSNNYRAGFLNFARNEKCRLMLDNNSWNKFVSLYGLRELDVKNIYGN